MAETSSKSLEGKTVMVTGASSGIGREFCTDLAEAGCRIIAAARRTDLLISLCNEINSSQDHAHPSTVRAVAVELDVSAGESAIEASVKKAWEAFGRIDALINNAGLRGGVINCLEWPEEEWERLIKTNLTGSWLVSKHVCRLMRDGKQKGSVINISSVVALSCGQLPPGAAAYIASKTGLNAITKVMALELGEYNIRVNAIAPGIYKSEITSGLIVKKWFDIVVKKSVPLQTYGTTDPALTSLVRYLIRESADYITGNVFIIDGGSFLPGIPIFSSL